ncbi:MAG: potassium channel family protein [Sphingomonas sp.]|uniref:potassium channel family protein n=1 Tax=Sphingomonas sp. TaxID=28214 RepID=UPI002274D36C|nr:potassium channel family protein [Sphingomonas sp.]MCX8475493.1 potassium channel family protein [Sphingomonas sp.]
MSLFPQLALSTLITGITISLHLIGLAGLMRLIRGHRRRAPSPDAILHDVLGIAGAAFGLFVLHAAEIWLYAALYALSGTLGSFEEALYFSTSTYTTIGYGDVVLPRGWRLLGAIEGATGLILLGWSTAFFVSVVGRIRMLELDAGDR